MPTLTVALRTDLLADTAIAALVVTRIRPRKLEQGETLPAIRITVVSGQSEEHLRGASGLAHATVQIDAYAATSEAADALAELIRKRLCPASGRRGLVGGLWMSGLSVQTDASQIEEPIDDGGDHFRFITTRDFRISHAQAVT